eukprot:1850453-Pleurochrysis_carterae.AAC.2
MHDHRVAVHTENLWCQRAIMSLARPINAHAAYAKSEASRSAHGTSLNDITNRTGAALIPQRQCSLCMRCGALRGVLIRAVTMSLLREVTTASWIVLTLAYPHQCDTLYTLHEPFRTRRAVHLDSCATVRRGVVRRAAPR